MSFFATITAVTKKGLKKASQYAIAIIEPTEGSEFIEGSTITVSGTITEI